MEDTILTVCVGILTIGAVIGYWWMLASIKKKVEEAQHEAVKQTVKKQSEYLVYDLFDNDNDYYIRWLFSQKIQVITLKNKLREEIVHTTWDAAGQICEDKAERVVYSEEFLDEIVERIRRKQLKKDI